MTFKRFSLRGFSKDYSLRRRVETHDRAFFCSATLYTGKHLRRKVDKLEYVVNADEGLYSAQDRAAIAAEHLLKMHGISKDELHG